MFSCPTVSLCLKCSDSNLQRDDIILNPLNLYVNKPSGGEMVCKQKAPHCTQIGILAPTPQNLCNNTCCHSFVLQAVMF